MVQVNLTREQLETLAKTAAQAGLRKQGVEGVIQSDSSATQINVSREQLETLAKTLAQGGLRKQGVEGVIDAKSTVTQTNVSRYQIEVLVRNGALAGVRKQGVEGVVSSASLSTTQVNTSRHQFEILAKRGPDPVIPLALVTNADFFLHNWADEVLMSSAFQTDVSFSPQTGAEDRRGLASKPARTLSFRWNRNETDRIDRVLVACRAMTEQQFQMPLYQDQVEATVVSAATQPIVTMPTNRGRFFLGARVAIVHMSGSQVGSVEFHAISNLTNISILLDANLTTAVAVGDLIFPVIDCEIELDVSETWEHQRLIEVKMEVSEVIGASQLPALATDTPVETPTYLSIPIFTAAVDWSQPITRGYSRIGSKYRRGRKDVVYTGASRARLTEKYALTGDRDYGWGVLRFAESRRGRLRSFFQIDQEFLWTIQDAAGITINVDKLGQFADFNIALLDGYVGFELTDGTQIVRKVTNIQAFPSSWRITLTDALPFAITPSSVVRFTRARIVRQLSDSFDEHWSHSQYFAAQWSTLEVLREQEVNLS